MNSGNTCPTQRNSAVVMISVTRTRLEHFDLCFAINISQKNGAQEQPMDYVDSVLQKYVLRLNIFRPAWWCSCFNTSTFAINHHI